MTAIIRRIVGLHDALHAAQLPHAFGGALALAWCTRQARGTVDIDVNVFVGTERVDAMLRALPTPVRIPDGAVESLQRDGQARLWWSDTPVDVFLNTTEFHLRASERARIEPFGGRDLPFLSCSDLAVFKAYFNRTKDWADLEAMAEAQTLDFDLVVGVLTRLLGPADERVSRLLSLDGGRQGP